MGNVGSKPNLLGEYLRARRSLVTPEQVGISATGHRRVPGLRREEVAMLAGISAEYYLRLEQGRDRNPSVHVLEAIARVLQVPSIHVLNLVVQKPHSTRRRRRPELVPVSTAALVATLPFPAFVEGRYLDVLAANALATSISPRLVVGGNRMRDLFTDPAEQALFSDWRGAAQALVAGFRQSVGGDVDDPRVIELVGELSLKSAYFRQVWARHDVSPRGGATLTIHHPMVGAICLHREKLAISGADGLMLVIYHPESGSQSEDKLVLLASTVATSFAGEGGDTLSRSHLHPPVVP